MVDLRPLSLGEIIDRSASIWRAHWKALFKLFLGFQLGGYVLTKCWELIAKKYFPISRGGARMVETLQADPVEALRQLGGSSLVGIGMMTITVFGSYFVAVAATRYIYPQMVGEASTLGASLGFAWTHVRSIAGFFGLMVLWTLLVSTALMVPGAGLIGAGVLLQGNPLGVVCAVLGVLLLGSAMVIAFLWFILRFMLAAQVLALEGGGAMGAFRRSNALSSGRIHPGFLGVTKVRLTIVFTVIAVIFIAVTVIFTIPQLIVQFVYSNPFDPAGANLDAAPAILLVPTELLQVVAQAAVAPLLIVFDIVFYADMRVRREGLDLELKMKEPQA